MDCLDYIYHFKSSVFYFDPPWPQNYKDGIINLSLSNYDLGQIVNTLLIKNPYAGGEYVIVIVKLPFNFNFENFEINVNQRIQTNMTYYTIYTKGKNPKIAYELAFIRRIA